jgi:lipid A disaccharide synthetase
MGWIIATIILTIFVTAMSFSLRNLLLKNEKLEDFISKQSEAINECDKRLKQIDDKGVFYSDDQIGWFFKEVKKIQEALNEFTLK